MPTFCCLYRKQNGRKNKSWEFDGNLRVNGGIATLLDEDGELVCRFKIPDFDPKLYSKREINKAGYDILLQDVEESASACAPVAPVVKRRLVFRSPLARPSANADLSQLLKPFKPPTTVASGRSSPKNAEKNAEKNAAKPSAVPAAVAVSVPKKVVVAKPAIPEGSVALPSPPPDSAADDGSSFKPVILDPSLARKMRPHQLEGLDFVYSCLMGFTKGVQGCILADDMGMGKTLQTIALIWTLLKQSPYTNQLRVVKKVLVCCPVSLVSNWKNEFPKWLGINRCPVLVINGSNKDERGQIETFRHSDYNHVMIIGYEKMVSLFDEIEKCSFDLLVCDEGHRLKSSGNKTLQSLNSLNIKLRLVITGTPIQNDLIEFHTIANFVVPGLLGDFKTFQKEFISPILKARENSYVSPSVSKLGTKKSNELSQLTRKFIIRRTNETLTQYLPPRRDFILLVQPSLLQLEIFKTILATESFQRLIETEKQQPLQSLTLINTFRKLCNSPSLLAKDSLFLSLVGKENDDAFISQLSSKVKSGKLILLMRLIQKINDKNPDDKVVIVSNFTSTLNIIQTLLQGLQLTFCRLDGSTPPTERQTIVNRFNKSSSSTCFAMLLSSKAGGVGLNLIGANRLIMVDNDWNPSSDSQAMGRIHRDGQKKECFIYRLITSGCIDEKIWQRQVIKQGLAGDIMSNQGDDLDQSGGGDILDMVLVKEVFKVEGLNGQKFKGCLTHDMMGCQCGGNVSYFSNHKQDKQVESNNRNEETEVDIDEPIKYPSFTDALTFSQTTYKDQTESQIKQTQLRMNKCLKEYAHLDPIKFKGLDIKDDILNEVLKTDEKGLCSWIFAKNLL